MILDLQDVSIVGFDRNPPSSSTWPSRSDHVAGLASGATSTSVVPFGLSRPLSTPRLGSLANADVGCVRNMSEMLGSGMVEPKNPEAISLKRT